MEDITDADHAYAKQIYRNFEIKYLRRKSWFVC